MKFVRQLHFVLGFLACNFVSFAQSENIWVTFEEVPSVEVSLDGKLKSDSDGLQKLIDKHQIVSVEQALSNSRRTSLQKVYEVTCRCDADELIRDINSTKIGLTKPERGPNYQLLYDPNDYNAVFIPDYALDLIKAKGAWDYSTGDSNTVLGISDANYHLGNIDLAGKWLSFSSPNTDPNYEHGTAVALTAAGNTNNGIGKSSIGFNCRMNLRSMNYNNVLDLVYAGSRVINLSWYSSCVFSAYVQDVIDEVYENGGIVIAAAGNGPTCGGPNNLVYPAACNHVIAVSSVGPYDNHEGIIGDPASCHQHNDSVDICAPGYNIATATSWTFGPTLANGTSFAAPYVTGTVGLMLSLKPCLTFEDIEYLLKSTAEDIDMLNPNYAGLLGAGRLDAHRAVKFAEMHVCNSQLSNLGPEYMDENMETFVNPNTNPMQDADMGVRVSYNPVTGDAHIGWTNPKEFDLKVLNAQGQVVHEEHVSEQSRFRDFPMVTQGIYFVQFVENGQQVWQGKVLKF